MSLSSKIEFLSYGEKAQMRKILCFLNLIFTFPTGKLSYLPQLFYFYYFYITPI